MDNKANVEDFIRQNALTIRRTRLALESHKLLMRYEGQIIRVISRAVEVYGNGKKERLSEYSRLFTPKAGFLIERPENYMINVREHPRIVIAPACPTNNAFFVNGPIFYLYGICTEERILWDWSRVASVRKDVHLGCVAAIRHSIQMFLFEDLPCLAKIIKMRIQLNARDQLPTVRRGDGALN